MHGLRKGLFLSIEHGVIEKLLEHRGPGHANHDPQGKLSFVGKTDTGRVRERDEDAVASDLDVGLLVLADGMGGYNAGEVASGIAVKTITNLVREGLAREDLGSPYDRSTGLARTLPSSCATPSRAPTRSFTRPRVRRPNARAWARPWSQPSTTTGFQLRTWVISACTASAAARSPR